MGVSVVGTVVGGSVVGGGVVGGGVVGGSDVGGGVGQIGGNVHNVDVVGVVVVLTRAGGCFAGGATRPGIGTAAAATATPLLLVLRVNCTAKPRATASIGVIAEIGIAASGVVAEDGRRWWPLAVTGVSGGRVVVVLSTAAATLTTLRLPLPRVANTPTLVSANNATVTTVNLRRRARRAAKRDARVPLGAGRAREPEDRLARPSLGGFQKASKGSPSMRCLRARMFESFGAERPHRTGASPAGAAQTNAASAFAVSEVVVGGRRLERLTSSASRMRSSQLS